MNKQVSLQFFGGGVLVVRSESKYKIFIETMNGGKTLKHLHFLLFHAYMYYKHNLTCLCINYWQLLKKFTNCYSCAHSLKNCIQNEITAEIINFIESKYFKTCLSPPSLVPTFVSQQIVDQFIQSELTISYIRTFLFKVRVIQNSGLLRVKFDRFH